MNRTLVKRAQGEAERKLISQITKITLLASPGYIVVYILCFSWIYCCVYTLLSSLLKCNPNPNPNPNLNPNPHHHLHFLPSAGLVVIVLMVIAVVIVVLLLLLLIILIIIIIIIILIIIILSTCCRTSKGREGATDCQISEEEFLF